jgi:hypothetical protein
MMPCQPLRRLIPVALALVLLAAPGVRASDADDAVARRAEAAADRAEAAAARSEVAATRTEQAVERLERVIERLAAQQAAPASRR